MKHKRNSAFSLVELSIVLVILGLLTGGIVGGQSLIKAAQLRAVIVEHQNYIRAVNSFKDKYLMLPGDMTNATAIWGIAAGTGNDNACRNSWVSTTLTCNGDGNGQVFVSTGSFEMYRAWQHMANAGLIEGQYNGSDSSFPRSKYPNTNWRIMHIGLRPTSVQNFGGNLGNIFQVGSVFLPEDMWTIDSKIDDGVPYTGKVWGYKGGVATQDCSTMWGQPTDAGAQYSLTSRNAACYMEYPNAF